jgi:hypothetical protein
MDSTRWETSEYSFSLVNLQSTYKSFYVNFSGQNPATCASTGSQLALVKNLTAQNGRELTISPFQEQDGCIMSASQKNNEKSDIT